MHSNLSQTVPISIPHAWQEKNPTEIFRKMLLNKEVSTMLPKTYTRLNTKKWDELLGAQQKNIIAAWNKLPLLLQTNILEENDEEVTIIETRRSNWNANDWARLIHLYHCPELNHQFLEVFQVKIILLSSETCHRINLGMFWMD